MKKIKSCLMTEQPDYYFDVEFEGDVIAECRMPDMIDLRKINKAEDSVLKMCQLLINDWAFYDKNDMKLDITEENIAKLKIEYQKALIVGITEKINLWNNNRDAISKNL